MSPVPNFLTERWTLSFSSGEGGSDPHPCGDPSLLHTPPPQARKASGKTVLEVNTPQVEHLPLLDMRVMDFGEPGQGFGFEVGAACFLG